MSIAFTGMFLRQCFRNKDGKRHAYWALVESFRTDAGPRQRIVAWLGKLDEAGRLGIEQAARDANSTHSKTSTTARDDQLPLFNRQVDEAPAEPQWVEVNASGVRVENCRQFGGPWLALQVARKLRLDEFLKSVMPSGREHVSWWRSALILVVARLCRPSSELYVAEQWYPKSAMPQLLGVPADRVDDNRLYRTLDQLLPHKAKLEAHLKNRMGELFDLDIVEQEAPLWHDDAQCFALRRGGDTIAEFYLDLYARANKRGGAWMADCRGRRMLGDGNMQRPVAFLVCNFTPPSADRPSLLTHNEVTTLFPEFGHGLHHMLSQIDCLAVSGINGVAWDAVELPSQFLENWCWEKSVIPDISGHYQTGEPLPEALLEKLLAAKNFQSGMQMLRQLEFALFDFRLHMQADIVSESQIDALMAEVRDQVAVLRPPAFNRFQNSFSHIFAGGYAAGYYSYKWAEVLSADAFSLFEERGVMDRDTGLRFRKVILEQGGARDAALLFTEFRGREPANDALLRHSGIAVNTGGATHGNGV